MPTIIIQTKTGGHSAHRRDREGQNHGGTDGDVELMMHSGTSHGPWVPLDNGGNDRERGDFEGYEFGYPLGVAEIVKVTWRIKPGSDRAPGDRFLDHWHLWYFNIVQPDVGIQRWEPDTTLYVDKATGGWTYYPMGETLQGGIFESLKCSEHPRVSPIQIAPERLLWLDASRKVLTTREESDPFADLRDGVGGEGS